MKLHERGLAMSKILIVEDEESIADIEKDYLELNGYEVEVCNDGTSGLAAALHADGNDGGCRRACRVCRCGSSFRTAGRRTDEGYQRRD